jgi:predicted amidohydrolase
VFTIESLTFGIVICLDSTYREPARAMAARGATALFVPTNNGLPLAKGGVELVSAARDTDIARARENNVSVIRADVVGRVDGLESFGSSGIVDQHGDCSARGQATGSGAGHRGDRDETRAADRAWIDLTSATGALELRPIGA